MNDNKNYPLATGLLDYFPDALAAVAHCSKVGNDQHNPGSQLHWDRSKSGDEADALLRHLVNRGTPDTDGVRHTAKVAWRALALLQKEIEDESKHPISQPDRGEVKRDPSMRPPDESITGSVSDPRFFGRDDGRERRSSLLVDPESPEVRVWNYCSTRSTW